MLQNPAIEIIDFSGFVLLGGGPAGSLDLGPMKAAQALH
jgi:hypothetical protein